MNITFLSYLHCVSQLCIQIKEEKTININISRLNINSVLKSEFYILVFYLALHIHKCLQEQSNSTSLWIQKLSSAKVRNATLTVTMQQNVAAWYVSMHNWWCAIMMQVGQRMSNNFYSSHPLCCPSQAISFQKLIDQKRVMGTWTKAKKLHNVSVSYIWVKALTATLLPDGRFALWTLPCPPFPMQWTTSKLLVAFMISPYIYLPSKLDIEKKLSLISLCSISCSFFLLLLLPIKIKAGKATKSAPKLGKWLRKPSLRYVYVPQNDCRVLALQHCHTIGNSLPIEHFEMLCCWGLDPAAECRICRCHTGHAFHQKLLEWDRWDYCVEDSTSPSPSFAYCSFLMASYPQVSYDLDLPGTDELTSLTEMEFLDRTSCSNSSSLIWASCLKCLKLTHWICWTGQDIFNISESLLPFNFNFTNWGCLANLWWYATSKLVPRDFQCR